MPTNNPRITITLQPSTHAQLRRISELTGNSQSALVSEILEESAPVFDRMITVLDAAQKAKESLGASVVQPFDTAQAKLEKQLGLVLDLFDEGTAPLLREMEAIQRRAARSGKATRATAEGPRSAGASAARRSVRKAGGGSGATPLSNRGVRSDPKKGKKSKRTRG